MLNLIPVLALVAVTVTGPGFSPLTSPEASTLAMCVSLTDQVTPCGALSGCTTAWSFKVVPTSNMLDGDVIDTPVTCGFGSGPGSGSGSESGPDGSLAQP